jgi:hypothetical protein
MARRIVITLAGAGAGASDKEGRGHESWKRAASRLLLGAEKGWTLEATKLCPSRQLQAFHLAPAWFDFNIACSSSSLLP